MGSYHEACKHTLRLQSPPALMSHNSCLTAQATLKQQIHLWLVPSSVKEGETIERLSGKQGKGGEKCSPLRNENLLHRSQKTLKKDNRGAHKSTCKSPE